MSKTDVSISAGWANLIGVAVIPVFAVMVLLPHWLIWGSAALIDDILGVFRPLIILPVFVVSILVHEALHGIGYVWFGRLPWSAVQFGFHWRALAPYARCKEQLSAIAYRGAIFLPGLMLGVIPSILGVIFGLGWLSLYGVLMLIAAGGDFLILWVIRRVAAKAQVLDHPTRLGCWVMTD